MDNVTVPIYWQLFDLLHQYIYGADTVLTGDMQLTLTVMATAGALFVVALPFLLVLKFVRGL